MSTNDLDLLTRDTILVSRVCVDAHNIDNIDELVNIELKAKEQSRVSDGFILKINSIIKIGDLILDKDKFNGESYTDVVYSAKILTINTGDVLYGCKIQMINKSGIFAGNNGFIRVLMPSDELPQNYQSTFKKNDSINVTVIAARSVIYNDNVIVYAKLHQFTIIPTKRMVFELSSPPIKLTDYTTSNKTTDREYLQLGAPSQTSTILYTSLDKTLPIPDLTNPFGDENLLNTEFKSNPISSLDLYSVLKTFRINGNVSVESTDPNFKVDAIKRIVKTHTPSSDSKSNILLLKSASSTELINKPNIREHINNVLTVLPNTAIINIHPSYTLEFAQQIALLRLCYGKVWLYKSPISIGYTTDYWIIAKSPKVTASEVKRLININKSAGLYTDVSLLNLTDAFLRSLRVFHSLVNKYRINKLIEIKNLPITLTTHTKEELMKQQSAQTSSLLLKLGLN